MGILDSLVQLGGKLGVVKIVSTSAKAAPSKIPTRRITLKDLATEIKTEQVQSLAAAQELQGNFAEVFTAAGIRPGPGGWSVDKLVETLRKDGLAELDRKHAQAKLLELLTAAGAHVHELVAEVIARDKALDAYEEVARSQWDQRAATRQERAARLEAQVQALRQELEQLSRQGQDEKAQWKQWHDRKIAAEKELAWAVSFLLDKEIVTVDHDH